MADIFLSYARGDRLIAERLADALERAGMEVWFDRRISGGTTFSDVIEAELDAAHKVVVLWSAESVKSGWVRDEATAANEMGKLVPVTIDGTAPPMGFRQIQTVDLKGWARKPGLPLPEELRQALGNTDRLPDGPIPTTDKSVSRPKWFKPALFVAGAALLAAGTYAFWARSSVATTGSLLLAVEPLDAQPQDSAGQALSKGLAADLARYALDASTEITVLDASQGENDADVTLTGAAETTGAVLHAAVRLLGRGDEGILWSKTYERPVAEAGLLRQEIAADTASILLCARDGNADELEVASRRLFLAACDQGTQDMAAGLANYRRVLEIHPGFIPARLRAAAIESAMGGNLGGVQGQAMKRHALEEAKAILREDPEAVQAYSILASNLVGFENWKERARLFELASAKPNTGLTSRIAYELVTVGRINEGIPILEQAVAQAPFAPIGIANLAEMYAFSGRLPDARALMDENQARTPGSLYLNTTRLDIEARVGDPAMALKLADLPSVGEYYSPERLNAFRALASARRDPALKAAARATILAVANGAQPDVKAELAQHLVQLGFVDDAYALAGSMKPGQGFTGDIWWRNFMAPFRADSRFPAFIEGIGQPMVWRETGKLPDYCATEKLPYDCRRVFLKKA